MILSRIVCPCVAVHVFKRGGSGFHLILHLSFLNKIPLEGHALYAFLQAGLIAYISNF